MKKEQMYNAAISVEMKNELDCYKTNHILHLILSLLTMGIWSFVWVIVAASNAIERNNVRERYNHKKQSNPAAWILTFWTFGLILVLTKQ